jgi:Zn-dependent peptidase ImmA (M78 family)
MKVPGRSRKKIRSISDRVRQALELIEPRIDVQRFLEHDLLEKLDVVFHIAEMEDMGEDEALTFPDRHEIHVREDVYEALRRGDLRARFTVIHEFAHWVLHPRIALARSSRPGAHQFFEDSEWQADAFAAEFLMPADLVIKYCKTAAQVAAMFGVSMDAAIIRVNVLKAEGLLRR